MCCLFLCYGGICIHRELKQARTCWFRSSFNCLSKGNAIGKPLRSEPFSRLRSGSYNLFSCKHGIDCIDFCVCDICCCWEIWSCMRHGCTGKPDLIKETLLEIWLLCLLWSVESKQEEHKGKGKGALDLFGHFLQLVIVTMGYKTPEKLDCR